MWSNEHKRFAKIAIVKGMNLRNTSGKKITTLPGMKRELLIAKTGSFLGISKKIYILCKILITLTKFPTCSLKYSRIFYLFYTRGFWLMKFTQTTQTLASVELYDQKFRIMFRKKLLQHRTGNKLIQWKFLSFIEIKFFVFAVEAFEFF